jgi:hypothetical protein
MWFLPLFRNPPNPNLLADYIFLRLIYQSPFLFLRLYGYFRPVIQEVVERYLDCGNPMGGVYLKLDGLEIPGNLCRSLSL